MVVTRSQTSAITLAAASKSTYKINKQSQLLTRSRSVNRKLKRSPLTSPLGSIHRSRTKLSKKILCNNNVSDIISFTDCNAATRARFSSSDSSPTSSTNSSRSSSSASSTNSSWSSSNSSSLSSSSSDSYSSKSIPISSIIENMNKMKINNTTNSFSSIDISSSQQSYRLPQVGPILVYKSTKNGDFLCLNGYTYQIDRHMKNKMKWKCKESRNVIKCKTKIYTSRNVGTDEIPAYEYLQSNNIHHSHDGDGDHQKVEIFKSQLKNIGTNNRTVPPSKLINQLAGSMKLIDTQLGMVPLQTALYRSVHRARGKTVPLLPKFVNFDIPATFSTTSSGENFIVIDHLYSKQTKRIIAFASPLQLNILFTAKLICIDGTFSICPRNYKQLVIIQAIDQQNYIATPVIYALLNDKKAHSYKLLFQSLKNKAKEMKMNFEPIRIISDFESGMILTLKKKLPNTTHQGCLFHLYQGLTKKMKKFGLWVYYKNNDELHSFIKKIMAIVLLKPIVMDEAYALLANRYLKMKELNQFADQLTKFMLYFHKQWMKLKIRKMISFYEVDFKTNNWSESYNAVLKRRAQRSHLSIWILIELLISEETAVRMKHFQFLNGKTKSVNKTIRDGVNEINQKIIEFNQQFENNEIELDHCLTSISALVGVKYDKWRNQRKKNKRRKKDDGDDDNDN